MKKRISIIIKSLVLIYLFLITGSPLGAQAEENIIWIEKEYDHISAFEDDLAVVILDGKYGYIDKQGKEVIGCQYDSISSLKRALGSEDIKKEDKFIMKEKDKEKALSKYDKIFDFSQGLAKVQVDNKYGYIDEKGQEVVSPKYDNAIDFKDGLGKVKLNGSYGYLDKNGQEIISPGKYNRIYDFKEGLAGVRLDDKYGYVDMQGREIGPIIYDRVSDFSDGLGQVKDGQNYFYINKDGEEVLALEYDIGGPFKEGLAKVQKDKKLAYIDKEGQEIIGLKYDEGTDFSQGLAIIKLGDRWGILENPLRDRVTIKETSIRLIIILVGILVFFVILRFFVASSSG